MRHSVQLSTLNLCATIFKKTLYFWISVTFQQQHAPKYLTHEQSHNGSKTNLTSKNMDFQGEFWKWKPQNSLHYGSDHLLLTHWRCLLLKSGSTCEYPEGFITRSWYQKQQLDWMIFYYRLRSRDDATKKQLHCFILYLHVFPFTENFLM